MPARDHPRSRGVYPLSTGSGWPMWGSSPLARGLLLLGYDAFGQTRIIPARAGFTALRKVVCPCKKDHPRSRGVYSLMCFEMNSLTGSSPLARGLRKGAAGMLTLIRIIPARAGFTTRIASLWRAAADHPRSRGVYLPSTPTPPTAVGSSPLARGLPWGSWMWWRTERIIPARAGFTWRSRPPFSGAEDHPRSRGVYTYVPDMGCDRGGSSPLARGLPRGCPIDDMPEGIIPARAGFTQSPT